MQKEVALEVTDIVNYGKINSSYPVCPGCSIPLEREYQNYCDRCGQQLSWKQYRAYEALEDYSGSSQSLKTGHMKAKQLQEYVISR